MVRGLRGRLLGKASGIVVTLPTLPVTQDVICVIDLLELACAGRPGGVIGRDTVRVSFERRSSTRSEGIIWGKSKKRRERGGGGGGAKLLVCLADVTLGGCRGDTEDFVIIGDSCRSGDRVSVSFGFDKEEQITHTFLV